MQLSDDNTYLGLMSVNKTAVLLCLFLRNWYFIRLSYPSKVLNGRFLFVTTGSPAGNAFTKMLASDFRFREKARAP